MPLTAGVPSTPMEAAIDQLRARFPNQIVVGFEELWDPRPDTEPHIDLGPPNASLQDVLARMRRDNPQYKVDLLPGNLVHVYPAHGSADPPGLLDLRLTEFFLPPDDCVAQQFAYMDSPMGFFSYTPELSKYLWEHKRAWYHAQGKEPGGFAGDLLGDCLPSTHRRDPIYHNITVREALNLMAIRSLQVASGQALGAAHSYPKARPISWKFRFRREPDADSGLGGVPIFQIF
ncbi:MAG TPA: hypothetical protein VMT56_02895 [Candidatus Bathyarchaeia archaeon]|nr:hypothetical protein [Candidatus Bathyarchaeia archaeon]